MDPMGMRRKHTKVSVPTIMNSYFKWVQKEVSEAETKETKTWRELQKWDLNDTTSSWWFQPLWKILVKMGSSSPIFGLNIKKYLSCHHPDIFLLLLSYTPWYGTHSWKKLTSGSWFFFMFGIRCSNFRGSRFVSHRTINLGFKTINMNTSWHIK